MPEGGRIIMNTFWLKIAGLAVVGVGAIVLIGALKSGSDPEPKEPVKLLDEVWEDDEKRLNAEPQFREPPAPTSPVPPPTQAVTPETTSPVPPAQPLPAQPTQPPVPQFEQLSMEEEFEAQKLWIWVENQRKMGRLPVMGYGQMVKTCRQIIQRWPRSKYAFFAKRALADLPERYHKMYNITKEEIDLGNLK
jgi:hypothetical protein